MTKWVAHSNEPTAHRITWTCSSTLSFIAHCLTVWPQLYCWFTLAVFVVLFSTTASSCFQRKALKIHCALCAQNQMAHSVSDYQVDIWISRMILKIRKCLLTNSLCQFKIRYANLLSQLTSFLSLHLARKIYYCRFNTCCLVALSWCT